MLNKTPVSLNGKTHIPSDNFDIYEFLSCIIINDDYKLFITLLANSLEAGGLTIQSSHTSPRYYRYEEYIEIEVYKPNFSSRFFRITPIKPEHKFFDIVEYIYPSFLMTDEIKLANCSSCALDNMEYALNWITDKVMTKVLLS